MFGLSVIVSSRYFPLINHQNCAGVAVFQNSHQKIIKHSRFTLTFNDKQCALPGYCKRWLLALKTLNDLHSDWLITEQYSLSLVLPCAHVPDEYVAKSFLTLISFMIYRPRRTKC